VSECELKEGRTSSRLIRRIDSALISSPPDARFVPQYPASSLVLPRKLVPVKCAWVRASPRHPLTYRSHARPWAWYFGSRLYNASL